MNLSAGFLHLLQGCYLDFAQVSALEGMLKMLVAKKAANSRFS
ncbi:hypothetical protein [Shewanella cyperi]|nr:hypothetical protein [Shewanella cyperi]